MQHAQKWMKLSEEEILEAYNKTNTLTAFCKALGYSSTLTKKKLQGLFDKYNLSPDKFNYHQGKDIAGQIFGDLEAIELDLEKTKQEKHRYWKCLCHGCNKNNIVSVRQDNLISGEIQSCGCRKGKIKREDLSGQIFGWLQAVYFDEEKTAESKISGSRKTYWKCRCLKCNREDLVSIHTYHLKTHHTTSCGCIGARSIAEEEIVKILKKNNILFKREYSFPDLKGTSGLLRFDFAIFKNKESLKDIPLCLIEYNGIQHYEPREQFGGKDRLIEQQERDKKKENYCKEHQIPLIVLNKWTGHSEETILKELKVFI